MNSHGHQVDSQVTTTEKAPFIFGCYNVAASPPFSSRINYKISVHFTVSFFLLELHINTFNIPWYAPTLCVHQLFYNAAF